MVLARRHVVRNALLLLIAVLGVATLSPGTVDPVIAALAAAGGAVGAVFVIRFDDLADLLVG